MFIVVPLALGEWRNAWKKVSDMKNIDCTCAWKVENVLNVRIQMPTRCYMYACERVEREREEYLWEMYCRCFRFETAINMQKVRLCLQSISFCVFHLTTNFCFFFYMGERKYQKCKHSKLSFRLLWSIEKLKKKMC